MSPSAFFCACLAAVALSEVLKEGLSVWMAWPRLELFDGTAIVTVVVPFVVVHAAFVANSVHFSWANGMCRLFDT